MNLVIWSMIFAFVWVAVTGAFTLPNLMLGLVFAFASLFLVREHIKLGGWFIRVRPILALVLLFAYELLMSAITVAAMVLRPNLTLKPGIFAYETELVKDSQIVLLANLITLTPGTLTVDVSDDKRLLYIHAVDCSNIDATRANIRNGFERKIREAFGDFV